jgi:hypothetical protein
MFLLPVGYAGHVVHSCASGARNVDALFFMLRWDLYEFDKKYVGTRYVELVFLHLVGSEGHVVLLVRLGRETETHYFSWSGGPSVVFLKSAFGHVMLNLCFRIRWDMRAT